MRQYFLTHREDDSTRISQDLQEIEEEGSEVSGALIEKLNELFAEGETGENQEEETKDEQNEGAVMSVIEMNGGVGQLVTHLLTRDILEVNVALMIELRCACGDRHSRVQRHVECLNDQNEQIEKIAEQFGFAVHEGNDQGMVVDRRVFAFGNQIQRVFFAPLIGAKGFFSLVVLSRANGTRLTEDAVRATRLRAEAIVDHRQIQSLVIDELIEEMRNQRN